MLINPIRKVAPISKLERYVVEQNFLMPKTAARRCIGGRKGLKKAVKKSGPNRQVSRGAQIGRLPEMPK